MNRKKILITGFGPFPGQPHNPSAALVRTLARHFKKAARADADFRFCVLKTEYGAGMDRLAREMERFKPDVVICFGVAAGSKEIRLERTARNRQSATKPDAAGVLPQDAVISRYGPGTLPSTLPLAAIEHALKEQGIPAHLSDDAGDYLCNHVFYRVMTRAQERGGPERAGFVHIPVPDGPDTPSRRKLAEAGRIIVAVCLK